MSVSILVIILIYNSPLVYEEGSTDIEYSNLGSTSSLVLGWGFLGEFMGCINGLLGSGKNFQGAIWFIQLTKEK